MEVATTTCILPVLHQLPLLTLLHYLLSCLQNNSADMHVGNQVGSHALSNIHFHYILANSHFHSYIQSVRL